MMMMIFSLGGNAITVFLGRYLNSLSCLWSGAGLVIKRVSVCMGVPLYFCGGVFYAVQFVVIWTPPHGHGAVIGAGVITPASQ
jgi:hypothetical protein